MLISGAVCTRLQLCGSVWIGETRMCIACNNSYHVLRQHLGAYDAPSLSHVISVFHAVDIVLCVMLKAWINMLCVMHLEVGMASIYIRVDSLFGLRYLRLYQSYV